MSLNLFIEKGKIIQFNVRTCNNDMLQVHSILMNGHICMKTFTKNDIDKQY